MTCHADKLACSEWGKFWILSSIWPWRSMSIAPKNSLSQGLLHLWSKFGDPSLEGWWIISRTSPWLTDTRTQAHTHTQATTIPEGQNWPRLKTHWELYVVRWVYALDYVYVPILERYMTSSPLSLSLCSSCSHISADVRLFAGDLRLNHWASTS